MVRRHLPALLTLIVLTVALPAVATTTTGSAEGTVTTAVAVEPAVVAEAPEADEAQPDWTYRFFVPTLLVLAALVVIATVVQYFTRVVRSRYRVVR